MPLTFDERMKGALKSGSPPIHAVKQFGEMA